jgi:arsenate reductase (thioredoxin)
VTAMSELGYDLTTHRSKSLEEVPPGSYDWVITMGCGDACPWIPARHREDWPLVDPRDLPAEEFAKVRDDIEKRVLELVRQIS